MPKRWEANTSVSSNDFTNEPWFRQAQADKANPDKGYLKPLGVAKVVDIDYEEHYVTLRTVLGTEQEYERVPVPLTYPGAGRRHFFGAMPEVGDYCVVGWFSQNTAQRNGGKIPVILSWILPGVMPGREWLTLSEFAQEEHDSGNDRSREEVRGVFDRIRFKLRHIQPGNIVATSSQGADLILDESAKIANRRGNEIILRDADQAVVTRALQQFTALAGTRIYSGMVQRDALRLPTTMFSDGNVWDGLHQAYSEVPVSEDLLPFDENNPEGVLTPHPMFSRKYEEGVLKEALSPLVKDLDASLDPYAFLRKGGFIDDQGVAVDLKENDAVYAGKNIYRIGPGSDQNTTILPDAQAFTEYRLEVSHTSDGRLPVTEQTDGFEVDRLPDGAPESPKSVSKGPFIEWVLGSVVGNDPYTQRGRQAYGLPLVAQVFSSSGAVSPVLNPIEIGSSERMPSTPVSKQAASLFKVQPLDNVLPPTWWSVNKQGQMKAYISGPLNQTSLEAAIGGAAKIAFAGGLDLKINGPLNLESTVGSGTSLVSPNGPVKISGGGTGETSVEIGSSTSTKIQAENDIILSADTVRSLAKSNNIVGQDVVDIRSAKQVGITAENLQTSVFGKHAEMYSGPQGLLPSNGALHEVVFSPSFPGTAEETTFELGDREETFKLGNHKTHMVIGDMTYSTEVGTWKAQAGENTIKVNTLEGINATATVGDISQSALAGSVTSSSTTSTSIRSLGPVSVRSGSVVTISSPGNANDIGPVLCAGTLEPFTGLPFGTWGLGAKTVVVGL